MTTGQVLTVLPFGNGVDLIRITGKNLRDQLELSVRDYNITSPVGRFLQFSGKMYNIHENVGRAAFKVPK